MVQWKRNLILVWTGQFLASGGFSIVLPFVPFYIRTLGVDEPAQTRMWVAAFAAAGNLALFVSAPFWGLIADIYGRRLMILRASLLCGLIIPFMAFVPSVQWLVALRFGMGLFTGTVTAAQVLVSSSTPLKHRGVALGAVGSAVYTGRMTGTFLGGIMADTAGFTACFLTAGVFLVAGGLVVLLGVKEDFVRTTTLRRRLAGISLRVPRLGTAGWILALSLVMGLAVRMDEPFIPLLVARINGPVRAATWTGITASLSAAAGMLSGALLGWLVDRSSPQRVAMGLAGLASVAAVLQGLAPGIFFFISVRIGLVFLAGGLASVFQIWLAKSTPDADRGMLFGWATTARSGGWFLSSLAGGAVAMHLGVRAVCFGAALTYLALFAATRLVSKKVQGL